MGETDMITLSLNHRGAVDHAVQQVSMAVVLFHAAGLSLSEVLKVVTYSYESTVAELDKMREEATQCAS